MELSQRLQNLPPYHFAAYARKIAEKRASGVDVISLSMGDPDLPTPPEVLDALTTAAHDPANQRYPEYAGMPELRSAYADWFMRRFGVTLDPAQRGVAADRLEGGTGAPARSRHERGRYARCCRIPTIRWPRRRWR